MNPLMEQMRTQLMSRPTLMSQGLVPRGPVSIEDATRHLYMDPEAWLNHADVLPRQPTVDMEGKPLSPWYNQLEKN